MPKKAGVFTPEGHAKALVDLVQKSNSLTRLDIWRIGLSDDEIHCLGNAMISAVSSVGQLRCDAFDLRDPTQSELVLRRKALNSRIAPLLAGVMSRSITLTTLDLQSNSLSDSGVRCLSLGLRCSILKRLNLAHNFVRIEGLTAIAESLVDNSSLTSLDLSSNPLCGVDPDGEGRHSCEGLKVLAASVARSAIECLGLAEVRLEPAGAKMLSVVIQNAPRLRELNVAGNNLTFFGFDKSGLRLLVKQAKTKESLRKLVLSDNHLTASTMGMIRPKRQSWILAPTLSIVAEQCMCHHCEAASKAGDLDEKNVDETDFIWRPSRHE